ncbi:MAG TPA: shikimate dehydrogenase [Planctomycetota bacterium]|nr:shikimate dehydrogenase [Planctomycetota bacterium]
MTEGRRSFKPELCCLFGKPVAENPTQPMIEAAFRHHGLDWRYVQCEIEPEALGDAVRGMRAMGFRGGNVTTPHKVAIVKHLDRVAESASLMGAVNCIVRRGAELVGENTDGKGFVQSLRTKIDPAGKKVVILGAGGAARAIAVELALAGASALVLVNRNATRGRDLVELLRTRTQVAADFSPWDGDYRVPPDADVLVQATSIGLFPEVQGRIPLDVSTLSPRQTVADVIPNPPETRLLREARARGCAVLDGLGMLVNQGVIGFKYWTGIDAEPSVMRRALESVFGG